MLVSLLLVGCWDERIFKDLSIVSLAGFEGKMGDLTAYYAYPQATSQEMKMIVITGKGTSPRDVRQNADLKTEQTMDLSVLSTLLISEETAKGDIYEYLDSYFRDPKSPVTPRLAIVQGELKQFFELTKEMQTTTGEFYNRFIKSLEDNSMVIPYNLQTAGSVLFQTAQDLALPYLKLDDENRPAGDGLALFSGYSFTGKTLDAKEGIFLNILNKSLGKSTKITYLYKDSPVSILVHKSNRKHIVSENEIDISIKIAATLTEFPQGALDDVKTKKELQEFLSKKIEEDMKKMMEKLQEAKCDAIGLGRVVRAYHPSWYEKDWHEKFSTLKIPIKVEVEIVKTGVLY
jgi:Ger(x)C family germination protein